MDSENYFNHFDQKPEAQKMVLENIPRLPDLQRKVLQLLQESKDPEFSDYLRQMQKRLDRQELQVKLLEEELTQRTRLYKNQMALSQNPASGQSKESKESFPRFSASAAPTGFEPVSAAAPSATSSAAAASVLEEKRVPRQNRKRDAEFAIGATVLGVTGSAFILIALILLGMYFIQGFMKGMLLYGICGIVLLFSELVLYRRWRGLGVTISALAMGGFYITTLVNYFAMKNFNQFVAIGITLGITVGVLLLSRKRDAVFYRLLGMVAVYASMLILVCNGGGGAVDWIEVVTVILMAFIVNLMCVLVPMRKGRTGIQITHLCFHTVFTLVCYLIWTIRDEEWGYFAGLGQIWQYLVFVGMSLLTLQLIYVMQVRFQEKQFPGEKHCGIYIAYCFSIPAYMLMVGATVCFENLILDGGFAGGLYPVVRFFCAGVIALVCGTSMMMLRKSRGKWFVWYLLNALVFSVFAGADNGWEFAGCLVVLLLVAKAVTFSGNRMAAISDACLTTFACLYVLVEQQQLYAVLPAAGLLISAVCICCYKVYFQTILSYTLAFYVSMHMITMFKLPVFTGILFVGILAYNYVKRWNSRNIVIFNILALAGQMGACLGLLNPVYQNAYLTYLCMLIFGIATIEMCFQKQCHMPVKGRELIMAAFLTYMGLIIRTSYPIVNSILLMVVSIACVAFGFVIRKKSVRIYGLVLSLLVCAKLVLYDFSGANLLQKTILFFAVGVIALAIAAIYMVLEHKIKKQEENI